MNKFLDDQLFEYTTQKVIKKTDDFVDLMNELFKICESDWKPKYHEGMSKSEVKVLVDRTFNMWNLFEKKLIKENYFLTKQICEYSYKKTFMENPELSKIYNQL